MTDRSSSWSITINNPEPAEYNVVLPVGWQLEGQLEKGKEGTVHYQGYLKTPQVRFSAVKKQFPRAHIEVARNAIALKKYVHKEETRVKEVQSIPTMFQYQDIIASMWVEDDYRKFLAKAFERDQIPDCDEIAMSYLDSLVAKDIESGRRGAEFIAINPMWRSSWKRFWRSIIKRNASQVHTSEATQSSEAPSGGSETEDGSPAQEDIRWDGSLIQGEGSVS